MISREELRQLATFECRHPDEFAISFYFKPSTPQDKSHRQEGILAKDLVRKTMQELQMQGHFRGAVEDLGRILELAERLHGNQARGKVVFACSARSVWHEFDVPAGVASTNLFVNRRSIFGRWCRFSPNIRAYGLRWWTVNTRAFSKFSLNNSVNTLRS